ncbi:PREDICTED: uncharacterized protein LOC109114826 [Nelumbo nucifera]|uniref:Uncharacterized protein LOC109114826 n=1 Tax=Nelumbo nucifera TaxID=4432 RepID=A0A1U8Q6C1_NELNU|nr:PREDICTED: uncharacterized protein LOC109114826 [Nelumbo nucifera]
MWLSHPGFMELVKNWWNGSAPRANWEGMKFHWKLKDLKAKFKEWNILHFGRIEERKQDVINQIEELDAKENEGTFDMLLNRWMEVANSVPFSSVASPLWSPPGLGCIKMNFDGSSEGNPGPSGVGGVFRDENGKVIALFSGPIGNGDSLRAEICALMEGLR